MTTTREHLTQITADPPHCAVCAEIRTAAIDALLDQLHAEHDRWAEAVAAGTAVCSRCEHTITADQAWHTTSDGPEHTTTCAPHPTATG